MLEALVSSRIRRALLEHLLTHSHDRFYLRGLAKELGLSVSPLRRELKRLERSGMLTAVPEGNLLFYTVNTTSATFLQLQQAVGRVSEHAFASSSRQPESLVSSEVLTSATAVTRPSPPPVPFNLATTRRETPVWSSPLHGPALISAVGVGIALLLIVVGLAYLTLTNGRLASQLSRTLSLQKSDVTVGVPHPSASGMMRGSRWHIVPGGFGGFSSGTDSSTRSESY